MSGRSRDGPLSVHGPNADLIFNRKSFDCGFDSTNLSGATLENVDGIRDIGPLIKQTIGYPGQRTIDRARARTQSVSSLTAPSANRLQQFGTAQ